MSVKFDSYSDEDLATETQHGSLEAFEELVFRYERRIYRFAAQWCHSRMDASEITQETFVKAYQSIAQFKPGYRFAAWLFTIARNKCIDHHRAVHFAFERQLPELVDSDDPAQLLEDQEQRDGIWNLARRALPAVQFQALWLRYVEDMNLKEVAKILRKTQMHVKVLLFRARRTMATRLTPQVQCPMSIRLRQGYRGQEVQIPSTFAKASAAASTFAKATADKNAMADRTEDKKSKVQALKKEQGLEARKELRSAIHVSPESFRGSRFTFQPPKVSV